MALRTVWKFATVSCAAGILVLTLPAEAADLAVLRNGFTISHDHRLVVGDKTRLFLSSDDSNFTDVSTDEISGFEKDLTLPAPKPVAPQSRSSVSFSNSVSNSVSGRSAVDLNQVVNSASAAYHLDPDLVNSVIHAESGFNSHAVSPKGARGLMQLMPSTASTLGVNDAFDPQDNVSGGSRYLRELLERYNFDLVKALAAYNAGPERVEQYNGVPPFHETRAYVARIVHEYNRKKIAQEKAAAEKQKQQKTSAKAVRQRKPAPTAGAHSAVTSSTLSAKPDLQFAANSALGSSPR